ncbi:MAG: AAA-like domain-containing protein [Cyanobacteria bacterium P01_D01_bin.105]
MIYQVGGSLSEEAPSYIERKADVSLCEALLVGEFCYILDSRQIGKSSLLVQTQARLRQSGGRFVSLDLTTLGSENVTSAQWYKGIGVELCLGFDLLSAKEFLAWWQAQGEIPQLQKLSWLIDRVLLPRYPNEPLYVFVDEVDSVLSLPFSADDWFALIRYCYNQRSLDPRYRQLTFAIAGVGTPSDLIADKTRTPFNIGKSILLEGFQLAEVTPLTVGLKAVSNHVQVLLKAVLDWTGGQPFLTQKLCQLLSEMGEGQIGEGQMGEGQAKPLIPAGMEADWVKALVRDRILNDWEAQDEPEHLRTIRDRLLRNQQWAGRLLGLYQKLLNGAPVPTDDSIEQTELLLSGLVIRQAGHLRIKNQIYQAIFNGEWVTQQLLSLRPYSQNLAAWVASQQTDTSRLLGGQALKDAQEWARGKLLDKVDYQFLADSEALDRTNERQKLVAARAQETESRLQQERRATKLQRTLLGVVSAALLATIGLGLTAFWQYRQAVKQGQQAEQETVRSLVTSAQALLTSEQTLDATLAALRATLRLEEMPQSLTDLRYRAGAVLRQSVLNVIETNRFIGHDSAVNDATFSPDGQFVASGGLDHTLRFWRRDGTLVKTVPIEEGAVFSVDYHPNGDQLVTGMAHGVGLWSNSTQQLQVLEGHQAIVWFTAFGPKGELFVSGSQDGTAGLWSKEGRMLQRFEGHDGPVYGADISPDQQLIASASTDGTARIWNRDGQEKAILSEHDGVVWAVAFSPKGNLIATTGQDRTVRLWSLDGTLLKTMTGHDGAIWGVTFSPDGEFLVSTSVDGTAKVWSPDGVLIESLNSHSGVIWGVDVGPDGAIATASQDQTVRLWQLPSLKKTLYESEGGITDLAFSPSGDTFLSTNLDGTVHYWHRDGTLLKTLGSHGVEAQAVAISPDETYVVSGSADNTAIVWSLGGERLATLTGHADAVYAVDISPDSQTIVTGSLDGVVKLWQRDGTLQQTIDTEQIGLLGLEVSPDGKTLVTTGATHPLRFWSLAGDLLQDVPYEGAIRDVAFSPDGQIVAVIDDNSVQLRRPNGKQVKTLLSEFEGNSQLSVSFSSDGQTIAVPRWDSRLQSWQVKLLNREGEEITTLLGHGSKIDAVAFSPDGKTLASGSFDKTIKLWNLEQILEVDLLASACTWVEDYLHSNPQVAEGDRALCDAG